MAIKKIEDLIANHPYYCSDSNYFSNDAYNEFETWEEFFEEWGNADTDYNLLFRFDIDFEPTEDSDGNEAVYTNQFTGKFFFMQQRKGIFMPVTVQTIKEENFDELKSFLEKYWSSMQDLWKPFSNKPKSRK